MSYAYRYTFLKAMTRGVPGASEDSGIKSRLSARFVALETRHADRELPTKRFGSGTYDLPMLEGKEYRAIMFQLIVCLGTGTSLLYLPPCPLLFLVLLGPSLLSTTLLLLPLHRLEAAVISSTYVNAITISGRDPSNHIFDVPTTRKMSRLLWELVRLHDVLNSREGHDVFALNRLKVACLRWLRVSLVVWYRC
jgi:hypothetical protein